MNETEILKKLGAKLCEECKIHPIRPSDHPKITFRICMKCWIKYHSESSAVVLALSLPGELDLNTGRFIYHSFIMG